jgi:hypothetical protein
MDQTIFETCLIAEIIRPEHIHKATILGFFGRSPYATIKVNDPQQPLTDLALLFLSRPLPLGLYRVGLSVKDPSGVLMFPMAEQTVNQLKADDTITLAYGFRPFRLTGEGDYAIFLLVNDKLDLQGKFTIVAAELGELA